MSRLFRRIVGPTRPRRAVSPKARLLLRALELRIAPAAFMVTNTGDTGTGSGTSGDLRYCITQSNLAAGPNTIDATGVGGTISLISALPNITKGVTITGPGASLLTINTNHVGSAFKIVTGSSFGVSNLTITGGSASSAGGAIDAAMPAGNITISNSVISGNTGNTGGGVYLYGGTLMISNSTLAGNTGGAGGAIYIYRSTSFTINNSTLANNTAQEGGGLFVGGFFDAAAITNSTISGNTATFRNLPFAVGGGINFNWGNGTISLDNTIVSGNSADAAGGADISVNTSGHIRAQNSALGDSTGYSLVDLGGNLTGANATAAALGLGFLGTYTGPNGAYPLVPLKYGSAALNSGDPAFAGTTDERGLARPQDTDPTRNPNGQPDMGASERVPTAGPDSTLSATNITAAGGTVYTFSVTYGDYIPINTATLGSGNVTVTTPTGVAGVAVTIIGANVANPNSVVATYQFTPPGGAWAYADDGTYAVTMLPNQVSDANGYASPGLMGTLRVQIARTLVVRGIGDAGAGSGNGGDLRYCSAQANNDYAAFNVSDAIVFNNSTAGGAVNFYDGARHTITLLSEAPVIAAPITVTGPGSSLLTITDATPLNYGVFDTQAGTGKAVALSGMTISGGGTGLYTFYENLTLSDMVIQGNDLGIHFNAFNSYVGNDLLTLQNCVVSDNVGGGIFSSYGSVALNNSSITGNGGFGHDGGLYLQESPTVLIDQCAVSGNVGTKGGAIYWEGNGQNGAFTITNSTIADNIAQIGGGISLEDFNSHSSLKIVSSTITGNTSTPYTYTNIAGYGGGGIATPWGYNPPTNTTGTIVLDDTIISGNSATSGRMDIAALVGTTVSAKYSALGTTTGFALSDGGHNLIGANVTPAALRLGLLANNGGPTQTAAIGYGSTAINVGDPALTGTTDQRGISRPQGSGVDIGAYEQTPGPKAMPTAANVTTTGATVYTFTVTYGDIVPIDTTTLRSGNVTVTGSLWSGGIVSPAVMFVGASAANPDAVVATYQFTPPGGSWSQANDGICAITMQPNQVSDANGYVPAGPIGSFYVTTTTGTLPVTNTNDSGPGSLRAAIAQIDLNVGGPTVITFSNSTAGGAVNFFDGAMHTIALSSPLPPITQSLTIIGPGANLLTVNANNVGSVFNVFSSRSFSLSNMTLTGGNALSHGGGINAATPGDSITVNNSVISGNTAATFGGGIYVYSGKLNIQNTTISNNSTGGGGGGGGITFFGVAPSLSIFNSTIADNIGFDGGGIFGLFRGGYGAAQITNSTITGNRAPAGSGGGICAFANSYQDLGAGRPSLDNTIVSGNYGGSDGPDISYSLYGNYYGYGYINAQYSALGTTDGYMLGSGGNNIVGANASPAALQLGALTNYFIRGASPAYTVPVIPLGPGSTATGSGDPAEIGTYDERGALRSQQRGVDIGAFEGISGIPMADANTHAVLSAEPATYQFTVTYGDDFAMQYSSIAGNANAVSVTGALTAGGSVSAPVTLVSVSPPGDAGTITATYQFTAPGGAWTTADNGTYTVNLAPNQVKNTSNVFVPGGAIGGIRVFVPQTLVVTNTSDGGPGSLRAAITAANSDAAIELPDLIVFNNNTAGGAVNFYDGTQHTIGLLSALPTIADPLTITGPGSGLLTVARGAGSFRIFDVNASQQAVNISGLTVSGGNGGTGAGIQDTSTILNLTDVTVSNNSSSSNGAGIYVGGQSTLNVVNCQVVNNSTSAIGGGIYSYPGSPVNITNSAVSSNTASSGGGLWIYSGTLTIIGTTLAGNVITNSTFSYYPPGGGAIFAVGSYMTITNSTLVNNSAITVGGAVDSSSGELTIRNCTLSGNTALLVGGAVYATGRGGSVDIENTTLVNNTAGGSGGAIDMAAFSAPATITSCTISGNHVGLPNVGGGNGGGGIAVEAVSYGRVTLDNTIVAGNSAVFASRDIYVDATSTIHSNYDAIGNTTGFNYTPGPGDLPVGANLHLQPLTNNGGPTQTIAFAAGSPLLNAGDPTTTLTTDQRGVPRVIGPAPDIGAYEYQPITVANVQINDGSAQRSEVRSISVTFSGPVSFANGNAAAAFQLQHVQDATNVNNLNAAVSTNGSGQTVVTLTFTTTGNAATEVDPVSASNGVAASLADGRYSLTVYGSAVTDAVLGWALDGNADGSPGGNYVTPADTLGGGAGQLHLYRIFGDTNGDGIVDQQDLGQLRSTLNTSAGNPLYLSILDADNSGVVDQIDLGQFRSRFNGSVF
jgi:hypothetical protein